MTLTLHFNTYPQASLDIDGDFDVHQRSEDGCIPPLLAMVRPGGCNTERGAASMEQEVLLQLSVGFCCCPTQSSIYLQG